MKVNTESCRAQLIHIVNLPADSLAVLMNAQPRRFVYVRLRGG